MDRTMVFQVFARIVDLTAASCGRPDPMPKAAPKKHTTP